MRAYHCQERVAVVDEKLGLNFIECEENSEGEVSLIPLRENGATNYDSSRAVSAHTASAGRCGGLYSGT